MRKFICCVAVVLLLAASLSAAPESRAQGAPSEAALERVFADISARIGRVVSRSLFDGTWAYEQIVVRDDNLGCPNGERNAPGQTRAWVVRVTVNGFGSYEYRISNDGSLVFFCTGVGVGASIPPTAAAPPAGAPPVGAPSGNLPVPPPIGVVASPVTFSAPILAFVGRDGNVYVTSLGSAQGYVPLTGDALGAVTEGGYTVGQRNYIHLRWSPNGSRLAFIDQTTQTLFVASSGTQPFPIASGVSPEFPPTWSFEGNSIFYVGQGVPSAADPNKYTYMVMEVPVTGGAAGVVARFDFTVGCGGGGGGASLVNYLREAGFSESKLIFKRHSSGFLHSMGCDGTGLALSAFDGTLIWSFPNVSRVQLSPDGARAVALQQALDFRRGSEVVLLDLALTASVPVSDIRGAEQLGWSGDASTLFFSVRELIQETGVSGAAPLARSFFAADGKSYRVSLFAISTTGGVPQLVYQSEGYAIAAITSAQTTSLTAFSIIESEASMIARINANDSYQNVLSAAPRVKIGVAALPLGTPGYPYVIGADGGQPAFSPAMSFTAIAARLMSAPAVPPVGAPPAMPTTRPAAPTAVAALRATDGENPLGLVVGGRAAVSPGDPVIVRNTPQYLRDRSNAIGILRPNELVRILVGPIFADDLRWWQVQREVGGLTGWVVDQYIDANGKIETNLIALR